MRALRKLQREVPCRPLCLCQSAAGPSRPWFNWLVKRAGQKAGLPFQAHAHMLRHACGYALANAGHDTGPCRTISGTAISRIRRGTRRWLRDRFKGFWRD